MRIGQSTDVHRLVEGRPLVIGGVLIPYEKGLLGHSDADVLIHAIAEALIGAMGLGDLGAHFPDNEEKWKGVSSSIILKSVKDMMNEQGFEVVNIDALIMIEEPKMAPHILQMRENISNILECDLRQVNIKATRGEGLGFVGRKEGALSQAVVLIDEVKHVSL